MVAYVITEHVLHEGMWIKGVRLKHPEAIQYKEDLEAKNSDENIWYSIATYETDPDNPASV